MNQVFKLTLALIIGIVALSFQSCGNKEKDEPDSPLATTIDFSKRSAIVGKWFQTERLWDDGTTTKSEDRSMIFKSDGTFEYHWGDGGISSANGTYTYTPISKNNGVAMAESSKGGKYVFTFENYKDYRYKVSIQQPKLSGVVDIDAVCIFGMTEQ